MKSRQQLYSTYRRIKKADCCNEWQTDSRSFYTWYQEQADRQENRCAYCHLPGCTEEYYGRTFRQDRRGLALEVDRKDNTKPYSPLNCVLACYPCNNAKSDVFSYDEFVEIGRTIGKIKKGANFARYF